MSEQGVKLDRRAALVLGLAGAAAFAFGTSDRAAAAAGEATELAPGVTLRTLGEATTQIPGFAKVILREVRFEPGSILGPIPMTAHLICTMSGAPIEVAKEGQPVMTVEPGGFYVCWPGEVETDTNRSDAASIMTVFELVPAA